MTSTDAQYDAIDLKILVTVDAIRAEHHACTARNVASQMHLSGTAVSNRMGKMRGEFLEWTKVAGSVHLLPAGVERVAAWKAEHAPVDDDGVPTGEVAEAMASPGPMTTQEQGDLVNVAQVVEAATTAAVQAALAAVGITASGVADPEVEGSREVPTSESAEPEGTPDTGSGSAPPSPPAS